MGFLEAVGSKSEPRPVPSGPRVPPSDAYAAAALKSELENIQFAGEGTRNHTLNTAAYNLAQLVNANVLDEYTVRDELTDAARSIGLDDIEIGKTLDSAFRAAEGRVRTLPEKPTLVSLPSTGTFVSPTPNVGGQDLPPNPYEARLLSPAGLRDLPEPKPLIDNCLDQGTTALLYGKWASGKSFIALDWACSVATGRPWQGRHVERAKVLYIVAEGVAGFATRLNAWEVGWRTPIDDEWMRFLPMPVNLMTRDVDNICRVVENGGYGFVVFDTLARCMVGGDENSAKDAGVVIDALTQVMYATPDRRGCAIGVHHTGKDGRTLRGSSAFESGVDTVYFAERDGQGISLRRTKRKDGPESDVHSLRMAEITGTDSCVIETLSENSAQNDSESLITLKRIFAEMFAETGVSSTELKNVAFEQGMSQATFYRARADLLSSKWILSTGSGSRGFFEMSAHGKAEMAEQASQAAF